MKLDILAIGAHPDDVELGCGGTLLNQIKLGNKVGIIDLTAGELGTRGSGPLRLKEAEAAAEILGVDVRENLGFADGFFTNDREHQLKLVEIIRKYQPEIILANAPEDRHPDHGKAANLVRDAVFMANLIKVQSAESNTAKRWKVRALYHYVQFKYLKPDFVVDISEVLEQKMQSLAAYGSQFHDPESKEPGTFISDSGFMDFLKARAKDFGIMIGAPYAEGFICNREPGVSDLFDLR